MSSDRPAIPIEIRREVLFEARQHCAVCSSGLPGYPGDIEDIRFLIRKMEIWTLAQVEELLGRFYPYDALTPRSRALIEGLLPGPESRAP